METLFTLSPGLFFLLFATGLSAGFVDSIAGGGGLITLPVLLAVGLPPQMALGTNKLQGSFGTLSASYNYIKKGQIHLLDCLKGIVFTFIGAVAGSWAVQLAAPGLLKHVIPVLLLLVLAYIAFSPRLGDEDRRPLVRHNLFFLIFGLLLGFYDGFFGPGTGSFWMAALCIFLGLNMAKAAGMTRVMNFTSNIVALSVFAVGHNVLYEIGLIMALGQIIGARLGSNLAMNKGARIIRPIFLTVVLLTIIKLIWQNLF